MMPDPVTDTSTLFAVIATTLGAAKSAAVASDCPEDVELIAAGLAQ